MGSVGRCAIGMRAVVISLGLVATAAPLAAQIVKPPRTPPPAGEYQNILVILPASWDVRSVTYETRGLSENTFLHRAYNYQFGCPADSLCYYASLRTDIRNRGLYDIEFLVTDGRGQTRTVKGEFEIGKPEDLDGDGMPNMWEQAHSLGPDEGGPNDDPDGDGVPNIEEYRRGTHPKARYVQYFGESSAGDRQGMAPCVYWPGNPMQYPNAFRYRLIGDDGRQIVVAPGTGFTHCPVDLSRFVADRVIAIEVESEAPMAIERTLERGVPDWGTPTDLIQAQAATQPSREWHFAQGALSDPIDVFLLAYNPNDTAVEAEYTFYGAPGEAPRVVTRTLAPRARTTFWVNADEPTLAGRGEQAVAIQASAPILMDRGLRWNPPGRTVPHESSSSGARATSPRWYFPHVDARRQSDERLVIGNPTAHETTVEFTIVHGVRDPVSTRVQVGPMSQVAVRVADFGRDSTIGVIATSTTGIPVVVELAQRGQGANGSRWAYSAPGATEAATEWALPQIRQGFRGDGLERGLVLMNPSSRDAEIEVAADVEKDEVSTRPVRYLVRVPAGHFKVMQVVDREPSATNPDRSEQLSYRVGSARIRSLPGPDGQPATPIVAARTSLVTAGGVRGGRIEHTILPRP
jgi:hypothetical protein